MTDYVTITINEEVLNSTFEVFIIIIIIFIFYLFIQMILDLINDIKKQNFRIKCKPYQKHYDKLKEEENYDEASKYFDKNKKYINNYY